MIVIKTAREIDLIRKSSQLAAKTLQFIEDKLEIGMATDIINTLCHEFITENDAYPSPLNYRGFPKSICTSLNKVICHGIPSMRDKLKNGDILNIDVTTYLNKFHGDTNKTFLIGKVSKKTKKLVQVTHDCMMAGIEQVKPGGHVGDIGAAIHELATSHGYSVVTDYCGHGIGSEFHEDPQIIHVGEWGDGVKLKPGMVFTIEPMINEGRKETRLLKDQWTVVTKDNSLSAQFEHTIVVTENGYEILTLLD